MRAGNRDAGALRVTPSANGLSARVNERWGRNLHLGGRRTSISVMTTTRLIDRDVWATLTTAARTATKPAHVAVAYFGKDGADLLPLPAGSKLVVDCGELAVKSGQTCPAALLAMHQRGVSIY